LIPFIVMDGASASTTFRWPSWSSAIALLVAGWVAIAALSLQVRPGAEIVAVAFPPWWTSQHVFEAAASAHAAIVRTTAISAVLVVRPNDQEGLQEGLSRLRQAGAWLAIDPQAIAACFNNFKN
jgi:hypothetical protein